MCSSVFLSLKNKIENNFAVVKFIDTDKVKVHVAVFLRFSKENTILISWLAEPHKDFAGASFGQENGSKL